MYRINRNIYKQKLSQVYTTRKPLILNITT